MLTGQVADSEVKSATTMVISPTTQLNYRILNYRSLCHLFGELTNVVGEWTFRVGDELGVSTRCP